MHNSNRQLWITASLLTGSILLAVVATQSWASPQPVPEPGPGPGSPGPGFGWPADSRGGVMSPGSAPGMGPGGSSTWSGGDPRMQHFADMILLVERMSKTAENSTACGLAALMGMSANFPDTMNNPAAQITFLEDLLRDAKNESIKRAIRMQLADLHRRAGQNAKALEQLRILITAP